MARGPQPIGNVLSELMARRGFARVQSAAALEAAWREAAGPLAARYTRVGAAAPRHAGSRRGQFDASSRSFAFQKPRPAGGACARLLPDEEIGDLRFRVGPVQ